MLVLVIKRVKVNQRSSFELSCKYSGNRCYKRSFTAIGQLVLEKKFYKFLPYMGVVAILIM